MESIIIWFASGFSFVSGTAFGFFCFRLRPGKVDNKTVELMQERNAMDGQKIAFLERIAEALEEKM